MHGTPLQVKAYLSSDSFRAVQSERLKGPRRGIIINAGGSKLLTNAVVTLRVRGPFFNAHPVILFRTQLIPAAFLQQATLELNTATNLPSCRPYLQIRSPGAASRFWLACNSSAVALLQFLLNAKA